MLLGAPCRKKSQGGAAALPHHSRWQCQLRASGTPPAKPHCPHDHVRPTLADAGPVCSAAANGLAKKESRRFIFLLAVVGAVGGGLRLYGLPSQILLDDEWLSLAAVIGKSYSQLFTTFNPADNTSLPFNLYDLALLHGIGWSEFRLRLPVILIGISSLFILPLLARKVFNDRVALIFACLLAIAPFLVFYSRYVRAYGLVALCGFSALLLFYQWLATGHPRAAVGFILTGALAIAAHLFSIIAIYVPLGMAFGLVLISRSESASSLRRQIEGARALPADGGLHFNGAGRRAVLARPARERQTALG